MVRTWITVDGEVLASEEWEPTLIHKCFWCRTPLTRINRTDVCNQSQSQEHEWVDVAYND